MREQLTELRKSALEQLQKANQLEMLNELKIQLLGKKGELTQILRGMGKLAQEERPLMGSLVNEVRDEIEALLNKKMEDFQQAQLAQQLVKEKIDVTLPSKDIEKGYKHPITIIIDEIKEIFAGMGFAVAEGPEIELDYYNFELLNIPKEHPARDMQDSFYISKEMLLRTHTSPVQARVMQSKNGKLPVKVIAPGKVFRRDDDATHSPMFHQVEGLLIDENITLADLKGILLLFAKRMFGAEREIRLRPSFFPFTQPSAEVDISCMACGGTGCRLCKQTGWIEVLGSGMVHPNVLRMSGYDPEKATGFAFGMGVERIAMLKYGIEDMRLLFDNDVRFLQQF